MQRRLQFLWSCHARRCATTGAGAGLRLSRGTSSCARPRRLLEDFLILGCSRCSHLEIGTVFLYDLYLAVFISMSGCCVWDAEHWILREVTLAVAQCLARRWLHVLRQYLAFGRIAHIFYVAMDSNPEVSGLRSHAEWSRVLSRCFSFSLGCAARTRKSRDSFTSLTWLEVVMM